MATSWWQRLFTKRSSEPTRAKKSRRSTRLLLEALEDRFMPATIFVHNANDGAIGALTPLGGSNFLAPNLRSAIFHHDDFTGLSAIVLDGGKIYDVADGQFDINYATANALTIKSSNSHLAVLDAKQTSRFFDVGSGGTTTLDHLRLTNGMVTGQNPNDDGVGGALVNNGDLKLTNDLFNNNQATGYGGSTPSKGLGGAVFNNGTLSVKSTTFDHNTAKGGFSTRFNGTAGGAEGGAICSSFFTDGTINITASTFSNNNATGGDAFSGGEGRSGSAFGGAVQTAQTSGIELNIVNSTFAYNTAQPGKNGTSSGIAYGGAIANGSNFNTQGNQNSISLVNDTIAFNHVFGGEGAVANFGAAAAVSSENTIIAKNTNVGAVVAPDVFGPFTSLSHNLIGNGAGSSGFSSATHDLVGTTLHPINPLLGALAANGGPTQTFALLSGSPAIDAGNNNALVITGPYDQRGLGFARKVNNIIDIGAFEVQSVRGRLLVHLP